MTKKTDYLNELRKDYCELLGVMEHELEKQYPVKVTVEMDSSNEFITIVMFDRHMRIMNIYYATEFECVARPDEIDRFYEGHPRTDMPFQDNIVPRFYYSFMGKHFEDYPKALSAERLENGMKEFGMD